MIATDPSGIGAGERPDLPRDQLEIVRDTIGITLVNRLPLESYLPGVVSAEMGRRNLAEFEALKAQAVVSRTYALRNMRRRAALGFDLHREGRRSGVRRERPETPEGLRGRAASTRGMVLTYQRSADRRLLLFDLRRADRRRRRGVPRGRPALPAVVPRRGRDGTAYCRISPALSLAGGVDRRRAPRHAPADASRGHRTFQRPGEPRCATCGWR